MFKRQEIRGSKQAVDKDPVWQGVSPYRLLLILCREWQRQSGALPHCYLNECNTVVRIQFPGACFDVFDLMDDYGSLLGQINRIFPLTLHGLAGTIEEGTLTVEEEEAHFSFCRLSPGGKDFHMLSDLYLKVKMPDESQQEFLAALVRGFRPEWDYIVLSRQWDTLPVAAALYEADKTTFYRYCSIDGQRDRFYDELSKALSVEQMTALWRSFLTEGVCWEELERVWEQYEERNFERFYRWELALKLAMEQAEITLSMEHNRLTLISAQGRPMQVGVDSVSGAKRLFAKILFPA